MTIVFYLWKQAFQRSYAGYASAIAIVLLGITLVFSIGQRPHPRARAGRGMSGSMPERVEMAPIVAEARPQPRAASGRRRLASTVGWYVAAARDRRDHGVPVLLDVDDVAQGPGRPDLVGAAAVHPQQTRRSPTTSACSAPCRSRGSS